MTLSLTLVVPCYREAARLQPARFLEFLNSSVASRLLFVDDGSPDETGSVLANLASRMPERISVLSLPENMGKGEAVRRGLQVAMEGRPDLVGFWDADLATPFELVDQFRATLAARPEVGWVFGARWRGLGHHIERSALRHYASRIFATVTSVILGLPVYDTQCGAKVFRVDGTLRRVLAPPFRSRWIFDVEILARLVVEYRAGRLSSIEGYVYELPLARWAHDKQSHLRWTDFVRAFLDLFLIWRHYLSARRPASGEASKG